MELGRISSFNTFNATNGKVCKPYGPKMKESLSYPKLDRLGRDLKHLVITVDELRSRNVGLKVLAGTGFACGIP